MQLTRSFAGSKRAGVLALLLSYACSSMLAAAAAAPSPATGTASEIELEIIPPPPGVQAVTVTAAAPALSATATSAKPAAIAAGNLALPASLTLPAAVSGLTAPGYLTAIAGNRSVLLSWYPSEGRVPVSGYLVYRGPSSDHIDAAAINAAPVTEPNYSDSDANSLVGPSNRNTYFYRVRAFDGDGRLSPYSDIVSASPNGPLLPPGKVEAAGADSRVLLTWSPPYSSGEALLAKLTVLRGEKSGELQPLKDLPPDATRFEDSGLPNGKAWFYALRSEDTAGKQSQPSPEVRGVPFHPLGPPRNLSALGVGDEVVRLKWEPPAEGGTFKVKGYNIYRSTGGAVDLSTRPVNKVLVPASRNRYEDSSDDSLEAPKKGTDYSYVVVAVDDEDKPSPASLPSIAGPVASLTKLETGEIEVTRGNTLQIQGRKTINASNTWVIQKDPNPLNSAGTLGGFQLDQQLQVRLTGKVGRKIKVDVDYDDKALANQQQKISVVYTGDQQEVFKEFAFGDIIMDLNSNRTEFAGYNKSLFGAKLKLESPDSKLRITAIGAQTKGFTETKRIVGGFEQAKNGNTLGRDFQDVTFMAYKYYYLSRDKNLVEGGDYIDPGSVEIRIDQQGKTNYDPQAVPVTDKFGTGKFYFVRMTQGLDYNVDNASGQITFFGSLFYIGPRDNIAVAYRVRHADGSVTAVGYDAAGNFDLTPANMDSDVNGGKTSNNRKLIQYGTLYGAQQYDSHMSMQYYNLQSRDILNPQLDPDFKLVVYGANQVPIYQLDRLSNYSDVVDFDTRLGVMRFRVPFPFAKTTSGPNDLRMDGAFTKVEDVYSPDREDAYSVVRRLSNFTVHVEYKYKVASFTLRPNIIRASELITLDGRKLARDVDYFLDYDSGSLVFSNPDLVKENSVVDATYEYLPFGGQFTSTVWGTRGEYDITKDLSVGSTFLWNSADAPLDTPDVRSAPYSLQILDGDVQANVPQDLLDGLTRSLPLLPGNAGVLAIKARAEGAHSWFQPNTYGRNNESGVAMIDSFEAIDNIVSTSVDRTSWFPSSRPLRFNGDTGQTFNDRMFTQFSTLPREAHDGPTRVKNNENPQRSMAVVSWAGFDSPTRWDAYVYPFGSSAAQGVKDASFLEVWIKVDTPVTLHLDVGEVNEDATGNGQLDTESSTGILSKDQDIGILNQFTVGSPYKTPEQDPGRYPLDKNYWGRGNSVVDTEDLDGNGTLNLADNYYTFTRALLPSDPSANQGFQLVQIPLTSAGVVGTSGLSVVPGNTNYYTNVKDVRLWFDNVGASSGSFTIESIQFKGNKWQVRADSALTASAFSSLAGVSVTADTSRFQVNAINRLSSSTVSPYYDYSPDLNFFRKDTSNSDDREQALQIEYSLTRLDQVDGKPYYQARRQLSNGTDVDAGAYQKLRVDLFKPQDTLPGERLLVRLGADDLNYFEYEIPLDSISSGGWQTVTLALDGSDGKRTQMGQPYLRQLKNVALAVHTLNDNLNYTSKDPSGRELLWVNNLRLTDAQMREGGAQRVGVTYDLMGGALTINHDIHEVDSDFIRVDQQANDPLRHSISQVVDGKLNAIQGVPVNLRYEDQQHFTDGNHREDPKYNRNFVDPDEAAQTTSGGFSFNKVPGLQLNASGSMAHTRQIFLPIYINSQRILQLDPADKVIVPNTNKDDLRMAQDSTYKIPSKLWVVGDDELRFESVYEEHKLIFDQEAVSLGNLAFRNSETHSRSFKGRYGGVYKWGKWLTLSPSYAYTLVEAEGNIAIPTVQLGRAYYDLGPSRRSDDYIPQSRAINPSLTLQFMDLGFLRAPKVGYNFTQTRDYVRNELRSPGKVDFTTTLNMQGAGEGWKALPPVDFSQTFDVDSTINNDLRIRNDARSTTLRQWMSGAGDFGQRYDTGGNNLQLVPNIAFAEQQQFLQSTWWVRLERPDLGENVTDPLNIENIAVSARRATTTNFTSRFDLPIAPSWTGTFTPHWNISDERLMGAPEQVTRNYRNGLGSGLDFRDPHIPFWKFFKPSNLTFNYSFNSRDSYLEVVNLAEQEALTSNQLSQDFSATLPTRPTDNMAITLQVAWNGTTETNFGPDRKEASKRDSSTTTPAMKLVYFLKVDRPWKLPDMWPFYGRELRIRQDFRLDNDLSAQYRRDSQNLTTASQGATGSDLYTLTNRLGYNVLDNVKLNFTLEQKLYSDINSQSVVNRSGDYYSIKFELGLEATF